MIYIRYQHKNFHRRGHQALAQAALCSGGVTIPGIAHKMCGCDTWRHGLVVTMVALNDLKAPFKPGILWSFILLLNSASFFSSSANMRQWSPTSCPWSRRSPPRWGNGPSSGGSSTWYVRLRKTFTLREPDGKSGAGKGAGRYRKELLFMKELLVKFPFWWCF